MQNRKYNIGLDIGVASLGYCVTDENNNLVKRNGKNMWGSVLFKEADTAKKTREYRGTKRRIDRRRERINILQSLIQEDMEYLYPNFFPLLRESSLVIDDKKISSIIDGKKYNLFFDENNTDRTYYKIFKTIYHLRNYLVNTKEKVDIRLVYLALHHIIKYRGNFLQEGDFSENTVNAKERFDIILNYIEENYDIVLNTNKNAIFDILKNNNMSKSEKKEKILKSFYFDNQSKQCIVNLINSFLGYSFDLSKIFNDFEIEKSKISFITEIENEDEIIALLSDDSEVYESMKTIYSWFTLQKILNGKQYISESFITKYNKYQEDLKILKEVYKKYFSSEYKEMFRKYNKNNYVAYNGKSSGVIYKRCAPEEFFKMLKSKIKELPDDCKEKKSIQNDLENDNFLIKLNVTDNGAIPHQLHKKELEKILENQSKYYKSLLENKEKILSLFEFRIPYYVGPLAKYEGKYSWIQRKSNDKIRPWNFEEIVDTDTTAEKFIRRMTNKCTYILNEDVISKNSILYTRFCVLNELNNIRVNNKHLGKDIKLKVIDELFKEKKKVTKNKLIELLNKEGFEVTEISGFSDENNFNSNMTSYIDMKNIFGVFKEDDIQMYEKIIYWITIFEDKKILKRKIRKEYQEISDEQLNKLVKLNYKGWSRLSKKLISGLKSNDGDTIIEKLEKTSLNFMQIINNKEFGFDKQLEKMMPEVSDKITYSNIEEIMTSPANKRAIWNTICVVSEIVKIMKNKPNNIYIEFARSEEKKERNSSRVNRLLKKYEEIESQLIDLKEYNHDVYIELKKHQNDKELAEKMYLYFIQNGKCLYSGKPLNIDELSQYEVDHIIPQSYRKNDSLDNKALVMRCENQRKKDSLLLEDKIIDDRITWWRSLLDSNLISQSKYYRLIKRKIIETDDEKEKFIKRQLVETRQITKYVTNLLSNAYKESNIYALRSELTHDFREEFKIYKNRNVNNFHHAHDAYILSTIGNILYKNYKMLEDFKYGEYVKNYMKENSNKYNKSGMIIGMVKKSVDISKIKKIIDYKDCFISRKLEEESGEFYNQTLYSPKDRPCIPLKNNKSVLKYGGYSNENKAYYTIFGYTYKNKNEYQLVGIPIKFAYDIENKKLLLENYIKDKYLQGKEYTNFKIIRKKVLKNQEYLDENNELMRFCSDSEIRPAKELVVSREISEQIYLMNMPENKLTDEQKEEINYIKIYDYLAEKLSKEYKIFNNIYLKLIEEKGKFKELKYDEKKSTINGLIDLMERGQGNLKNIGLGERAGRKSGQNFGTKKLKKMIFIDKSITGMYERRFKIDGMENSSSK